jgi:hypothetical protein
MNLLRACRKSGSSSSNPLAEDLLADMLATRMAFLSMRASVKKMKGAMEVNAAAMDVPSVDTMDVAMPQLSPLTEAAPSLDVTMSQMLPVNETTPVSEAPISPKTKGKSKPLCHNLAWTKVFTAATSAEDVKMKDHGDTTLSSTMPRTTTTKKRRRAPTPPPNSPSISPQMDDREVVSDFELAPKRRVRRKIATGKTHAKKIMKDNNGGLSDEGTLKGKPTRKTTTAVQPEPSNDTAEDTIIVYQRPSPAAEENEMMQELSKKSLNSNNISKSTIDEDDDMDSDSSYSPEMKEAKPVKGKRGKLAKSRRDMGKLSLLHETKTMSTEEVDDVFKGVGFCI